MIVGEIGETIIRVLPRWNHHFVIISRGITLVRPNFKSPLKIAFQHMVHTKPPQQRTSTRPSAIRDLSSPSPYHKPSKKVSTKKPAASKSSKKTIPKPSKKKVSPVKVFYSKILVLNDDEEITLSAERQSLWLTMIEDCGRASTECFDYEMDTRWA
jgi:hypothetical protein